jgi:hypothetical protein
LIPAKIAQKWRPANNKRQAFGVAPDRISGTAVDRSQTPLLAAEMPLALELSAPCEL